MLLADALDLRLGDDVQVVSVTLKNNYRVTTFGVEQDVPALSPLPVRP
jgi:hypothetical protein